MYSTEDDTYSHDKAGKGHDKMRGTARNANKYRGADCMPIHPVNLDAVIRREDFEVSIAPQKVHKVEESPKLKIVELEADSFMYRRVRKPDFQRTTAAHPIVIEQNAMLVLDNRL